MPDFLKALNPAQLVAVTTVDGPLLIVAGAGTGKTRTLVYRLAYLADQAGIPPEKLLALTFTVKAAEEMRERAQVLCRDGLDLAGITLGTFHSLCFDILKQHGGLIGLQPEFAIVSPAEQQSIIADLADSFFKDVSGAATQRLCQQLTIEKSVFRPPDQLTPFCRAYQSELSRRALLDFDDLILKALALLQGHPAVAEAIRSRFSHISVDEYQDVSRAQYQLLRLLCARKPNLCAVGDADQAIYAFRGAQVENFLNFQIDFPDAAVCYLDENYRSTGSILDAAHHLIRHNRKRIEKTVIATRPPGPKLQVVTLDDDQAEADWIAREIESLLGGTGFETMCAADGCVKSFSDIAVLYRLRQQSRPLAKALAQRGIPVTEHSSRWLFENRRIKTVLDLLEVMINPMNDSALADLLHCAHFSPGAKSAERLIDEAARQQTTIMQLCREPSFAPGLQQRARERIRILGTLIEDLQDRSSDMPLYQLINWLWNAAFGAGEELAEDMLTFATAALPFSEVSAAEGAPRFLKKMYLLREGESVAPVQESVRLMTAHGAKGLEFSAVFVTGVEQDLFPYHTGNAMLDEETHEEEERRLFYVAMTRARNRLYLVNARSRFLFGRRTTAHRSKFISEIPLDAICRHNPPSARRAAKKLSKQMKLFDF